MANSEKNEMKWIAAKLLVIAACAFLYSWGGMEMKWLRRYLAPGIAVLFSLIYSRNWRVIFMLPMMGTLSMGYGGDALWYKIFRRGVYGLANGVSSSGYLFARRAWLVIGFQICLLVSAYISFGVFNPFGSARIEETVIGLLVFAVPVLSVQRKKD